MNQKSFDLQVTQDSLQQYLQTIALVPLLTPEQEFALATKVHQNNDLDAARKLIMANLRFVVYIANSYQGYGLNHADLIQEGNIGLMKAVKKFDPNKGVRLVTFAVHWIRSEITEYVIKNWRIVKIATTKAQRKLFFNLRSMKQNQSWLTQEEATQIAKDLNVSTDEVFEMERRLEQPDKALEYRPANDEQEYLNPIHSLEAEDTEPETLLSQDEHDTRYQMLVSAVNQLPSRDQDILYSRYFAEEKATLHDLADKYQISAERVRQLEAAAIKKVKNQLIKP